MTPSRPARRLTVVARLLPIWTSREVRAQYRQSAFDLGWSLLTPLITLAGFGFVLTKAFGVDGDGVPYLSFAWCGVVVWTFFASGLTRGASSLVTSSELIRKLAFPREVVPLAAVCAAALDLLVGLTVLVALALWQGVSASIHLVAALPVLAVLVLSTAAWAVLFATATAFVRDIVHGLGVILRIGIFVTPVMYPVTQFPPRYRWVIDLNPVAVFIEALRDATLRHRWPDWDLLAGHAAVSVIVMALALASLARVGGRLADVI